MSLLKEPAFISAESFTETNCEQVKFEMNIKQAHASDTLNLQDYLNIKIHKDTLTMFLLDEHIQNHQWLK